MIGNFHPDLVTKKLFSTNRIMKFVGETFKCSKIIFIHLQNSGVLSNGSGEIAELVLDKCRPGNNIL